jgi:hypothetical protein
MKLSYWFEGLKGIWSLKREIKDIKFNNNYDMRGSVLVQQYSSKIIDYNENIIASYFETMLIEKSNLKFTKSYTFTLNTDKNTLNIYEYQTSTNNMLIDSSKGLIFSFNFENKSRADASHICKLDYYQASLDIFDINNFQMNLIVKGPNKEYTSFTQYSRNTNMIL